MSNCILSVRKVCHAFTHVLMLPNHQVLSCEALRLLLCMTLAQKSLSSTLRLSLHPSFGQEDVSSAMLDNSAVWRKNNNTTAIYIHLLIVVGQIFYLSSSSSSSFFLQLSVRQ